MTTNDNWVDEQTKADIQKQLKSCDSYIFNQIYAISIPFIQPRYIPLVRHLMKFSN